MSASVVRPAQDRPTAAGVLPRDDRILPLVKIVGGLVILVLLLAFYVLYLYPDFTDQGFAWTIKPNMTALFIGAGYMAGAYFFFRVVTGRHWHHVQRGFLPITLFTILMLGATLLHWDRFHQGQFTFLLWTVIYILTPLLVPFLWWLNRRTDPGTPDALDKLFAPGPRRLLAVFAAAGVLAALVFFAVPQWLIQWFPWTLTPLTARVTAGWGALGAATVWSVAQDARWSAYRLLMEAGAFGLGLMMIALPRAWGDLNPANPLSYVFAASLAGLCLAFIVIHIIMDRARTPQQV